VDLKTNFNWNADSTNADTFSIVIKDYLPSSSLGTIVKGKTMKIVGKELHDK